jgi:hypothetical protein
MTHSKRNARLLFMLKAFFDEASDNDIGDFLMGGGNPGKPGDRRDVSHGGNPGTDGTFPTVSCVKGVEIVFTAVRGWQTTTLQALARRK